MRRTKKRRRIVKPEVLQEDLAQLDIETERLIDVKPLQEHGVFRNIEMGRNNTIRFLLEQDTASKDNIPDMRDNQNRCPLMKAVDMMNPFLVVLFLVHGFEINHQDKEGNTVFHILAKKTAITRMSDWLTIFWSLLRNGGNRFIKNKKKKLPIELLKKERKQEMKCFKEPKTEFECILCHDEKHLEVLLSTQGVIVSKTNNQGKSLFQLLKDSNLIGERRDNTKMANVLQKYGSPMISLE